MPVLAADEVVKHQEKRTTTTHTRTVEKRHSAKHHAKHHRTHNVDSGSVAVAPVVNQNERQERLMDINNAQSPVSTFDWVNRFHFSGEINVDLKYSNHGPLGIVPSFLTSHDTFGLNVNNANLFVDVDVNRCVTGHIGVAYVADSVNMFDLGINTFIFDAPITDSLRSDRGAVWANGHLGVDEAYITIRDFAQTPLYLRAGKMYVDFGYNPNPYPISYSYTQLLTQTRATTGELGWASCTGLYGSIFALEGAVSSQRAEEFTVENRPVVTDTCEDCTSGDIEDPDNACQVVRTHQDFVPFSNVNNFGAKIGFAGCYCEWEYNLSASYLNDIRDVDYLAAYQDLAAWGIGLNGVN
ncbi:MAG: hypothetical protein M3R00_10460, partial [Pseudomonadota bacterium]|nr:hypothetical protein [Pseudomonadota bacterium]